MRGRARSIGGQGDGLDCCRRWPKGRLTSMAPEFFALRGLTAVAQSQEAMLTAAALITLAGTALCWTAPNHRMSMEERAKDGKLSETEARRRILFREWSGPAVTVIGCVLLLVAVLR